MARSFLITAAAGIFLVSIIPLEDLSYDVATWLKPSTAVTNAVAVYVNQETLKLGTDQGKLNRTFYTRLLGILTRYKAKLVFMDAIFDQPASLPATDQTLATAIRNEGSVILVAGSSDNDQAGSKITTFYRPISPIADAALGWGHAEALVRQIPGSDAFVSYAGWVAATNLAPHLQLLDQNGERWLNYYGSPDSGAFSHCTLQDALANNVPAGFFSNKIVFVGQNMSYGPPGSLKDTCETPYSRFGSASVPGVLVHATAVLNLVGGDWLKRVPRPWQWLGAVVWSLVSVGSFYAISSKSKALMFLTAAGAIAGLFAVSLWLQWQVHLWWAWVGPVCAQTPLALVLVMLKPRRERYVAFISYRTEEDGAAALLIKRSLADHGLRTFIDVHSLRAGRFDEQLLKEIESARFFILILSPNSLARCANDGDWVLRELTHAQVNRKEIIPVFKAGFQFNALQGIPDLPQIAALKSLQGVAYSNSDFDGFIEKLRKLLEAA